MSRETISGAFNICSSVTNCCGLRADWQIFPKLWAINSGSWIIFKNRSLRVYAVFLDQNWFVLHFNNFRFVANIFLSRGISHMNSYFQYLLEIWQSWETPFWDTGCWGVASRAATALSPGNLWDPVGQSPEICALTSSPGVYTFPRYWGLNLQLCAC